MMTPEERRIVRRAVARVNYQIKVGHLVRQPCEVCGFAITEAHHRNGYGAAHVLDVVWLCSAHHASEHDAWKVAPWLAAPRFDGDEPYRTTPPSYLLRRRAAA